MALTDIRVRNAKPRTQAYKLSDGGGMYLLVAANGARYWRLDYRFGGKRRTLALGVYPVVTLANARSRREAARVCLADNRDPSVIKKQTARAIRYATENTFKDVAGEWIESQRNRLSPRYRALLLSRLEADIFPYIGTRPVGDIDAPELLDALREVEQRGAIESAGRLRQTCSQVFRYAIATGRAKHDPSADLRGAIRSPPKKRGHKAMSVDELPRFLAKLDTYDGEPQTRLALRLMVITFARTTELRAARWSEFEQLDGEAPLWRVPAGRMKMKREHLVPLAPQAVEILGKLRGLYAPEASPYVFASPSREGFMSNNTMLFALYRLGYHGQATVHGFRAMASTALNEMGFRPDVIERQLSHEEKNAVRAAYNRAEYIEERRAMMVRWAEYIDAVAAGSALTSKPPSFT